MRKRSSLAPLAALSLGFLFAPRETLAQSGPEAPAILDELAVEVYRAPDTLDVAAGLNLGNMEASGFYWYVGGRLSWIDVLDPGPEESGLGVGGVAGFGATPYRLVSPLFRVAIDRTFGLERYEWQTMVSAGVRVRVFPRVKEHMAMTFSVFRVDLMGDHGVPDTNDYGLGIFYSAAVFERR